mgnify:CR=1 FL=1
MSYTVENLEKSMAKITITVDADAFEEAMVKSYNKNKKNISIQGFRKGKAPRKMVEKLYGPEVFYEDAANFAIPDAYEEAAKESGLEIVSRPEIDVVEIEKGKDFVFTATVAVKPEVTLGDYKGIEVEKKTVKVMAADVNAEIDKVREQNSRMITVENRGIKKDDTAVIDFEGFVDGEPFQGGKGEDYSLVIGSHSFIDTFEDQLVGKKAGEEVDVNVTFPEEYHEASLKGKPALFKVTVKEIKKKELPKLDDEFASEVSEFETLKEYKASVKKNLTERRKEEAKREKENEVVEKVVENITVELPEPMIDEQTQQMIQEFAGRLSSQGLSFDQYMQMTGMTADALMGQMKPEAEKRIRTRLALEAIVDAEKIKATAKDIDKEIENMANMYQMEVDKIKEMIEADEHRAMLDMVEEHVNQEDYTSMDMAAALLKMIVGDTLDRIDEVENFHFDENADTSRMVRLFINVGKKDKITPANILGAIAGESGMPGRLVGAIDMMDNYTFVDVPAKHAEAVLAAMNDNVLIKGRKVNVEKANVSAKPARKSKSKPDTRRRKDESRGKHDKLKERRSKSGKVRRNGEKY